MLEFWHDSTAVGENIEYCISQMPRNALGGHLQISNMSLPQPKLNLQISFPNHKLYSPGKKIINSPPQANQSQNFHSSPKVWGGMTL